jgi:hypothetical protein
LHRQLSNTYPNAYTNTYTVRREMYTHAEAATHFTVGRGAR